MIMMLFGNQQTVITHPAGGRKLSMTVLTPKKKRIKFIPAFSEIFDNLLSNWTFSHLNVILKFDN